jgi:hypothetical protein
MAGLLVQFLHFNFFRFHGPGLDMFVTAIFIYCIVGVSIRVLTFVSYAIFLDLSWQTRVWTTNSG